MRGSSRTIRVRDLVGETPILDAVFLNPLRLLTSIARSFNPIRHDSLIRISPFRDRRETEIEACLRLARWSFRSGELGDPRNEEPQLVSAEGLEEGTRYNPLVGESSGSKGRGSRCRVALDAVEGMAGMSRLAMSLRVPTKTRGKNLPPPRWIPLRSTHGSE